jgi:hypothetical protein
VWVVRQWPYSRAEGGQVEPVLTSGWNSEFIACCGLEQSQDQEGEAELQQAGNPEGGHEVFATKSVCRPEPGAFSRVQMDHWPIGGAHAGPLEGYKPDCDHDDTGPEKAIAELGGRFPSVHQANDRYNDTGNERKKDGSDQDAQDRIFHGTCKTLSH